MLLSDSSPEGVNLPGVRPTPPDLADLDLEKALLSMSVLPVMVTPLIEPVEVFPVAPSMYPEPPVPVQPDADPGATSRVSPLRLAADGPILDVCPSYLISPTYSIYEPSPLRLCRPCRRILTTGHRPVRPQWISTFRARVTCCWGIRRTYPYSRGRCRLFRSLLMWLWSRLWVPRAGSLLVCPRMGCRTCLGRAPLMCIKTLWCRGPLRRCWDLPGCQYRMTSYDDADRSNLDPAYGLHLHDLRLLEYVGVPELARLLSRAPEYWMHHMGRDRAMSAALQLQHDAGLILSNLQVLGQFVTLLNRMSSEVMRLAFAHKPFPTEAVQSVVLSHRVRRAAHYMSAMGLWRPPSTQDVPGPRRRPHAILA